MLGYPSSNNPGSQPLRAITPPRGANRDSFISANSSDTSNSEPSLDSLEDEPRPPYTKIPVLTETARRHLNTIAEVVHVQAAELPASIPAPSYEPSLDTAAVVGETTTAIPRQIGFYSSVSPSITADFSLLPRRLRTIADPPTDQAMADMPETLAQPGFRYLQPSDDIMADFDVSPPLVMPFNPLQALPPATAPRTPTVRRGYSQIAVSILDDFTGTPFSSVELGTQQCENATRPRVTPEEPLESRFGQHYQQTEAFDDESPAVIITRQRVHAKNLPDEKECPICAEPKALARFPIFSVTSACLHPPEACLDCLGVAIRTELNTKHWKDIRCPECHELLEYVDVQRYADDGTFSRYENLALRAAMHQADNFIWCTGGCGSGQIHETGAEQPIVICLHCNSRSCFTHEVAWHDGFTCEEYDSLLADPENFRSRIEVENAALEDRRRVQDAADHALAGRLAADQEAEERTRVERERQARRKAAEAAEKARKTAARRKREDEQSMATMNRTTKKCPGCDWAIEKNSGWSVHRFNIE
ncbi:hypothetical protein BN1723_012357 [Verticillium longisporum]|uniref:RBR-type E3 ubiquitin transferase n=1 Tax=Verticillium longisporum TaxID=100787 RepID=A0A0G4LH68_VERLO|nr:hypothetical protein BN1723_012357 [Verticillium longisporum]